MVVSTDSEHFDWLLVKSPCNANFGVGVERCLINTTQPISVINQCAISKLSPQQGWGTRSWVLGLLPWLWHSGVVFGEAEQKSHGHQGHQVGPGSSKRSSSAELPGSLQQSYRHKENWVVIPYPVQLLMWGMILDFGLADFFGLLLTCSCPQKRTWSPAPWRGFWGQWRMLSWLLGAEPYPLFHSPHQHAPPSLKLLPGFSVTRKDSGRDIWF